jgi:hypothetical protein
MEEALLKKKPLSLDLAPDPTPKLTRKPTPSPTTRKKQGKQKKNKGSAFTALKKKGKNEKTNCFSLLDDNILLYIINLIRNMMGIDELIKITKVQSTKRNHDGISAVAKKMVKDLWNRTTEHGVLPLERRERNVLACTWKLPEQFPTIAGTVVTRIQKMVRITKTGVPRLYQATIPQVITPLGNYWGVVMNNNPYPLKTDCFSLDLSKNTFHSFCNVFYKMVLQGLPQQTWKFCDLVVTDNSIVFKLRISYKVINVELVAGFKCNKDKFKKITNGIDLSDPEQCGNFSSNKDWYLCVILETDYVATARNKKKKKK